MMPYTVAHKAGYTKQHEFDAYVRLLERRGIDWSNVPRTPDAGTDRRWLYVWTDRKDAESFAADLRQETRDDHWFVYEFTQPEASTGPLMPILIRRTQQSLGSTFTIHPHSKAQIRRKHPEARQVSSVSIEHGASPDGAGPCGEAWEQVVEVLTGLTQEQLHDLGGYQVVDPFNDEVLYDSNLAVTAAVTA